MSDTRFVVAVDFGTTHSGFAFVHKSDPSHIEAFYDWEKAPAHYSKTLSALLYDSKKSPISWGHSAHHDYLSLSEQLRGSYTFMTKFKLFLDETYKEKLPLGLHVLSMIGDYLKFMKKKIMEIMSVKFGSTFSLEDIQWCLTVPAIWSDRAKDTMRKAAVKAGIISTLLSTKLSIILEPEAAAVHMSQSIPTIIHDQEVFLVLDAGGGTVDLTVHQMYVEQGVKKFVEVVPGLGKSCGSTFIDDRFLNFFREKVGDKAFDRAKVKSPIVSFILLKSWEPIKRNFDPKGTKAPLFVQIPCAITAEMSKKRKKELEDAQEGFNECVFLHHEDLLSFFDPVVKEVVAMADKMVKQSTRKVKKILCVGGFSESKYLLHCVREHFEKKKIEVICPQEAGTAVLKGAVEFGLRPSIIDTRRSRWTYGISVGQTWTNRFAKSKRCWDFFNQRWMVPNVFDKLVEMGEAISVDQKIIRIYSPASSFQQFAGIKLYASKEKYPKYTDSEECFKLGEIVVPVQMDELMNPDFYILPVIIQFGTTEISVRVQNVKRKEEHILRVNYDTGDDKRPILMGLSTV